MEINQNRDPIYSQFKKALNSTAAPLAWLDFHALKNNMNWILTHSGSKKIRLGTKSIRCRWTLETILKYNSAFQGMLTMNIQESVWLAHHGFTDFVIAYPAAHISDFIGLSDCLKNGAKITLMADRSEHLDLYQNYASTYKTKLRVALDIDVSSNFGFLHFGVYRSSLKSIKDLKALLSDREKKWPNLQFVGLMAYEAQIAGVPDHYKNLIKSWVVKWLKSQSRGHVTEKRQEAVSWLKLQDIELEFVNGGGTGSLNWTSQDPSITEITIGSGFYAPSLFDNYQNLILQPAAGFALRVSRHPEDKIWTCTGGGYPASGSSGADRLPQPYLPSNLCLIPMEGAGEVQTPLQFGGQLSYGDLVFFRHAKAGELCERFSNLHIIENDQSTLQVPTYRGEGQNFL